QRSDRGGVYRSAGPQLKQFSLLPCQSSFLQLKKSPRSPQGSRTIGPRCHLLCENFRHFITGDLIVTVAYLALPWFLSAPGILSGNWRRYFFTVGVINFDYSGFVDFCKVKFGFGAAPPLRNQPWW